MRSDPPRPLRYPTPPPTKEPARAWLLFWGRFVPATCMGLFVGIAVCWVGYLVPFPFQGRVVMYFADKPLPVLTRWILGIAVVFGLAVTFFPRPRDQWGRVQRSWFDELRAWSGPWTRWWR